MQSPPPSSKATTTTSSSSSSSAAESSMGDATSNRHRMSSKTTSHLRNEADGSGGAANGGDPALWAAFTDNFHQVQSVLDRNRLLIQQVNDNHQSKIHDNMVKNVALIQEINGNISKVVSLYSNLSSDFMTVAHQRNASGDSKSNSESEGKS